MNGQRVVEIARSIKSSDELAAMRLVMSVCDLGVERMRARLRPGITENELWSILHQTNIAHDGEWIECRLLSAGQRTNPWFQECGPNVINAGDLVAFDTDLTGPLGYFADISRTWVCPGRKATPRQKTLYALAREEIQHNMALLRPGLTTREFCAKSWRAPDAYREQHYQVSVHAVGMGDEFPEVAYPQDFASSGYDAVFEENMVIAVESYIGEVGGPDGVKLEEQVILTEQGPVTMSRSPFENGLELE